MIPGEKSKSIRAIVMKKRFQRTIPLLLRVSVTEFMNGNERTPFTNSSLFFVRSLSYSLVLRTVRRVS